MRVFSVQSAFTTCFVRRCICIVLFQLSEKIDQSHALALQHSKTIDPDFSASFLTELEEQVNKIDADCLDIVEESNEINVKLKELGSGS